MIREFNLHPLPEGKRYEDTYGKYLDIFGQIAMLPASTQIKVTGAPWSWYPLLYHLNCYSTEMREVFDHCDRVRGACLPTLNLDRTDVEVLCSFRPETADALWKVDMQWRSPPGRVRSYQPKAHFIITTNGAYHRPEVLDYIEALGRYKPTKKKVVLVPCAADKPYPSPLHHAVLERMPQDYYLMNATGVLGLVPMDLWPVMPYYDSGIPNEWRLFQIAKRYFADHEHEKIIVYCDYYTEALHYAFMVAGCRAKAGFVMTPTFYTDYIDLLQPGCLSWLEEMFSSDIPI